MIFFTIIGLIIFTVFFACVLLVGISSVAYNPTASKWQTLGGWAAILASIPAIYVLWSNFSPFSIVVAP